MKTLNRPTASIVHTNTELVELNELSHRVRQLWASHLRAAGDEQERLVVALSNVDACIERLTIRANCGLLTTADVPAIAQAGASVKQLEAAWNRPPMAVAR